MLTIRLVTTVIGILLIECLFNSLSLDISFTDLESTNKICANFSSCVSPQQQPAKEDLADVWLLRNCQCDRRCNQYGDCCVDSPLYDAVVHRKSISSFTCETTAQANVYMKKRCPPAWRDSDVRRMCESSNDSNGLIDDPLLRTPVTSLPNGVTYGNVYCASCNDDDEDLRYWDVGLQCNQRGGTQISTDNVTDVRYNARVRSWQIVVTNGARYDCPEIVPSVPTSLKNSGYVRSCLKDTVRTCSPSWTMSRIRDHCEGYTSVVYNGKTPYRNVHCAICNGVPVQNLTCEPNDLVRWSLPSVSFTVLFDFSGGNTVGKRRPCTDDQLYDPFFKKCRDVLPNGTNVLLKTTTESRTARNITPVFRQNLTEFPECPKYVLTRSEYVNNGSAIFVPEYKTTFQYGSYALTEDGSAMICVSTITGRKFVSKYKPYFGLLTLVGIGISVLCLATHLLAFSLVEDLRNLSGMNLASYCVALLITYCSFISSGLIIDEDDDRIDRSDGNKGCLINAVITYYFLLAAFFWMMTIAFDVWRALRVATSELRVNSGKQWKKFVFYSCWSWLTPATIVLASILVEMSPEGYVPEQFRPNFGVVSCWFGRGEALLVFLGVPLAVVMACNLVFFVSSSIMIYSSRSMTVYSAGSDTLKNFKLFSRLALIMGLTWITGLIGGAVEMEFVWVIFIVLNTLQGLFVFVGFTCRRRVLNALKQLRHDGSSWHLPTFSVSSATSNDMELAKDRKTSGATVHTLSTGY